MGSVLFITPELGDSGDIVSESAGAASMPAINIQKIQPTDRWRSTDTNPAFFEMDFGSALDLDFVALLFTQATNAATWRVRLATSQANLVSAPSYDTGTMDHWPNKATAPLDGWLRTHAFVDLLTHTPTVGSAGKQTRQWLRVDVTDSTNPDGYYEMGRFYAGVQYRPTVNVDYGSGLPFYTEEVRRYRSEGGLVHPAVRPRGRAVDGVLKFNSYSELMTTLFEINRLRGVSQDLLYIHDIDDTYAHMGMLYGLMSTPMTANIPEFGIWQVRFKMEELL